MSNDYESFDLLRQRLQQEAISACTLAEVAHLKLPNRHWVQPDRAIWVSFEHLVGETFPAQIGEGSDEDALDKTAGIIQFDVFAPEKSGDGPATRIADKLRKCFNRKKWLVEPTGHVTLYGVSAKPMESGIKGWFRVCVDGPFIFHHRN